MTREEFIRMYERYVSKGTIEKYIPQIRGYSKENPNYIPDGSRYKFDGRFKKSKKISFVIAEAIYGNRYIDASYFGITEKDFVQYLDYLVQNNVLCRNGSSNMYGANMYSVIPEFGEQWIIDQRRQSGDTIARSLGTLVGAAVGTANSISHNKNSFTKNN